MNATTLPRLLCDDSPDLSAENALITRAWLSGGAQLLTSLTSKATKRLMSSSLYGDSACRLARNTDGSLELKDSLWRDYGDTHTDLHAINELIRVKDRIVAMCNNRGGDCSPVVILDWGCGAGHTLVQLDAWLQQENIRGYRLYGFANQFHLDWHCASENITFILDMADTLPMYFKRRSVDQIYSIAGLYYMFLPEYSDQDSDMVEYFNKNQFDGSLFKNYPHTDTHLEMLSCILKIHGEILIDLPIHVIDVDFNLLKTKNRHYTARRDAVIYGEHAYVILPRRLGRSDDRDSLKTVFYTLASKYMRHRQRNALSFRSITNGKGRRMAA